MHIEHNKSLREFNTFGIDVNAAQFASVKSTGELRELLRDHSRESLFILGGGSNMLLTKEISELVVHIDIKGIEIAEEDDTSVTLKVMAGENWHDFVMYCVDHGYGGIENLSLIPGNVGAAPIQNIGAYGVELKDVFIQCEALNLLSNEVETFDKEQCKFDYRDSVFKNELKGKYVIVSVTLNLSKEGYHKINSSYGAINDILSDRNISEPGIKDISEAVISIRRSKLPDPDEIGNSGSFFKNPVLTAEAFNEFLNKFPEAPYYTISENEFKVPAGWLIQQAGFKGVKRGDAGVHDRQALVLVNHGSASGTEILELSAEIQEKVLEMFNIPLEREVNVF